MQFTLLQQPFKEFKSVKLIELHNNYFWKWTCFNFSKLKINPQSARPHVYITPPPKECVHLTSSNSQIQNKRATKGFILIRHKRYQTYTCSQLSSSIASFVWKPAHFELRSYGGVWHNTKIAFVEKHTLISWFLAILGVYVSGKVLL